MSEEPKESADPIGASDASLQEVHADLLKHLKEPKQGYSPMPLFLLGFI